MKSRMPRMAAAVGLLLALAPAVAGAAGAPDARGWVKRLVDAGRGEVAFVREGFDPLSGDTLRERGRLALEPPGHAEVSFARTGERLTVRPDGGEWLQPGLAQMIRFGPGDAGLARAWWELLIAAADAPEVAGGERRVLGPERAGVRDSAWVALDRTGLPARLTVADAGTRVVYRFERWKFVKPRGAGAFRQRAPAGVEIVDLR